MAVFCIFWSFSIKAQNVLESKNLGDFYSLNSNLEAGWPWTGCREFEVTITTWIGFEIDVIINHCCVRGVCAAESVINVLDGLFGEGKLQENPKDLKQITISKSSKVKLDNYLVNIKDGTYNINSSGQPDELIYEAILIKQ